MLFEIIFLVSLISLTFLYLGNVKKLRKERLHSLRKSCIIDSVRFEKRFLFIVFFIKKQILGILSRIKKIFWGLHKHKEILLKKTKKNIRKKLLIREEEKEVSEFISEMKK